MDALLKNELDWIDRNTGLYDSVQHSNLVKHNIMNRYLTNEIKSKVKKLVLDALNDSGADLSRCGRTKPSVVALLDFIGAHKEV